MWSLVLIAFTVLFVFFYSLLIKFRARKARKSPAVDSFSLPVDKDERRFMSETVPVLLQDYNVFLPAFLSRYAAQYLSSGSSARFSESDLVEGVESGYAAWVLNHCSRIASARYNNLRVIQNAEKAEADYVVLKLFNTNPACPLVPKSDKKYKAGEPIPLFPCADCKEDKICGIWYKPDWD